MKHMGKGLAFILALCMAISGVFASAPGCNTVKARESEGDTWVEHTDGNGYWYREMEGGGIEITAFMGPTADEDGEGSELVELAVPAALDGKKVVRIGTEAYVGTVGYCRDRIRKITVPEGITSIGVSAFSGCQKLEELILPDSLTSLEESIVSSCGLAEITIPKGVVSVRENTFEGCDALRAIRVAGDNSVYAAQDGILYNKAKTTLLCCPQGLSGSFTIPENVTAVGDYAFAYCGSLTGITIGGNVGSIGKYAFYSCANLEEISVPGNVKTIGENAFHYCNRIKKIVLNEGLITIGSEAFVLNNVLDTGIGMEELLIPASITDIGNEAFAGNALPAINVAQGNKNYASEDGILYDRNKTILLTCPGGKISQGKVRIVVPSTVQSIAEDAFDHYSGWPKKNVTLACYQGSPAQEYALANDMAFEIYGKAPVSDVDPGANGGANVKYTVTFDKNGGNDVSKNSITVEKGKKLGELPTARRKGYVLAGWYTAKTGGVKITPDMKADKNQTAYAHWQKVTKPKKAGKPSLKSKKSGQLMVSYKKVSGVKGYEICYSLKKNFKGAKKLTTSKTKLTIKKLKKKKIYYVRVCAYKLDSTGGKIYGSYGASVKLKVK